MVAQWPEPLTLRATSPVSKDAQTAWRHRPLSQLGGQDLLPCEPRALPPCRQEVAVTITEANTACRTSCLGLVAAGTGLS